MSKLSLPALTVLLLLAACSTVEKQRIELSPIKVEKPISASPSFVTPMGEILDPSEWESIEHFSFLKIVNTKPSGAAVALDIGQELDELLAETGADALVNLTIAQKETSIPGRANSVEMIKSIGSSVIYVGAIILSFDLIDKLKNPDRTETEALKNIRVSMIGLITGGAAVTALGFWADSRPGSVTFLVEGDAVRRK